MAEDTRLNELLSRWEHLREQGQEASSEQLCAEYPELADEFRRHVRALEAVNARIGSAEQDTDPAPRPLEPVGPSVPQLLHTRSSYRVLSLHARGGLGEVLLAQDEELHREVALKRIQEPFGHQPDRRERFLREAEITSRLEHPGIVPVYGLGQDGDGRPCYVMRLIRGETLQEAIRRFHEPDGQSGLDMRKLLGRFVAVCNAVAYAHSQGVVHRDLKPANIMLGPYGETLVVDWGLAKRLKDEPAAGPAPEEAGDSPAGDNSATETGSVFGTPIYMSPEQAEGRGKQAGPASDIYSLGATLYTLLTGRSPFKSGSGGGILDQVRRGAFPRPREAKAGIPASLEAVCLKAMALQPERRYETALALAGDMEHWLADEPVSAFPDPLSVRVARRVKRHKTAVTGVAALLVTALVALAAGIVVVGQEQQRTEERRLEAVQAGEEADAQASVAEEQRGLAVDTLNAVVLEIQDGLRDRPEMQEIRKRLLRKAREGLARASRSAANSARFDQTAVWAELRLGELAREAGDYAEAGRYFRSGLRLAEAVTKDAPGGLHAHHALCTAHLHLGNLALAVGDLDGAAAAFRQGLPIAERLHREPSADFHTRRDLFLAYIALADVSFQRGQYPRAEEIYRTAREAIETLRRAHPEHVQFRQDVLVVSSSMGLILYLQGKLAAARLAAVEALAIAEELSGADPSNTRFRLNRAGMYGLLACVDGAIGDAAASRKAYEKAVTLVKSLIKDDPRNQDAHRTLVELTLRLGELKVVEGDPATRDLLSEALRNAEAMAAAGTEDRRTRRNRLLCYLALGRAELYTGNPAMVPALLDKAAPMLESMAREEPASSVLTPEYRANASILLGDLYLRSRDEPGPARKAYLKALPFFEGGFSGPRRQTFRPGLASLYNNLGYSSFVLSDWAASRDHWSRGATLCEQWVSEAPQDPQAHYYLALMYYGLGVVGGSKEDGRSGAVYAEKLRSGLVKQADAPFFAAAGYAQCAAAPDLNKPSGQQTPEENALREQYVLQSMKILRELQAGGYFKPAAQLSQLKTLKYFDSLRGRPDFRKLLAELEAASKPVK